MSFLYHEGIYRPLLNLLIFFYNLIPTHDLGFAIIALTLLIRLILFPLFKKSAEYQRAMRLIQPKVKKIQEEYKSDSLKQTENIMALYREHKLNPFSGFLFLLLQLPILFALYHIFLHIFDPAILDQLYSFVIRPSALNPEFLSLINLGNQSILMVVLAAIAQFFQAKLMLPPSTGKGDIASRAGRQMMVIGPLLTLLIFYRLPAAVSLYWVVASVFSVIQELIINRKYRHGTLESNPSERN